MNFEQFRHRVKSEVFDYQTIAFHFGDLKKVRDKISALVSEGKIIRIKKGLYVFGEEWRRSPLHLELIANLLYGPSCISFEYALGSYGMIPERSHIVTSLTIGDSKAYDTPLGSFEYRAIDREKFKVGIEYRDLGNLGGYFLASREKALADLVYRTPGIRTLEQLRHYLFQEMRIDESLFRTLDIQQFQAIAHAYNKRSVNMLCKL
jgi:predicted transcriptional regulator of viral defense system